MANYYATARSNYFAVKDEEAFKEWASKRHLEVWDDGEEPPVFAISPDDPDSGSWELNFDLETDEEIDVLQELSEHLDPNYVAILMEAGAEKKRYVSGFAFAVSPKGQVLRIALSDIYDLAQKQFGLGMKVTPAEY
jgi:hypothetical protein